MANANTTASQDNLMGWTADERAQIAANSMNDDVFADRLFEQLKAAPALLSHEQVENIEKAIRGDQVRRSAFALSSLTGDDLLKKIETDREFAVIASGIAGEMDEMQEKYKGLIDLFGGIHGRIIIALASREDMQQVIEDGKSVFA